MLISITLAAFLVIVGAIGVTGYRLLNLGSTRRTAKKTDQTFAPRSGARKTEYPVEHGDVIRPEELHGHGQLYFVPVGAQAIPVQSLADYYREKFGTPITVLPHVEIRPDDCVPLRRQCVAEELQVEMTNAYPEISRNPDSVMIALTDEDIFPRELGWRFTYSLHGQRIGIVSTRRMDPGFWSGRPNAAARLASTRQMLTKYVAMMYYRVPASFDPTSVMYTPLTPDGGSDDLHESDLHPESSANGRRGTPYPCLSFTYSYQTHEIKPADTALTDCQHDNPVHSGEETFGVNLSWGTVMQRSLDLALDSTPGIEFRRAYNTSMAGTDLGLGWGVNHNYNAFLSSDGLSQLTYIDLNGEANLETRLLRLDSGRGFNANAVYESHTYETYGAQLKWESGQYRLRYRDGASSTFYECGNDSRMRCYWNGYQDGRGNTLSFDRGPLRELRQLTAGNGRGISFQYDDQKRMTEAKATDGNTVAYEYDDNGCLAKVVRADGQATFYTYDPGHRMTAAAVARRPGTKPEQILAIEYDTQGRIVKLALADIGTYEIEYLVTNGTFASGLRVTDPAGQVLKISMDNDDYVARTDKIRFPVVVAHR